MARARIVSGKVIVLSVEEARELYSSGFYGQPLGVEKVRDPSSVSSPLVLDSMEALYLAETGRLVVEDEGGKELSEAELAERLGIRGEMYGAYLVYRDLRSRGLIVRSGLKYGASFVAYRRGPGLEHAPFVIHYYSPDVAFDPVELVRAGRVSHSVRKTFVLATAGSGPARPTYIMFKWLRP
ncbi:MAG: tRNA-intron lyase [Acidilobus sp.]